MNIVSPTTTERIVRTTILTGMFVVFASYFIYDGFKGYPAENLKKAIQALDPIPESQPPLNESISRAIGDELTEMVKAERTTRLDVITKLGEPGWSNPSRDELRYFGPGGVIVVELAGDLATSARFEAGAKTEADLIVQKVIGFILVPVSVFMLFQLIRVLTTRVELNEEGLLVRGRARIPFTAMKEIRAESYRKKGYLDVIYELNGAEKSVRLDDYVIREFRPIVETICQRRNLENPLPPPEDDEE